MLHALGPARRFRRISAGRAARHWFADHRRCHASHRRGGGALGGASLKGGEGSIAGSLAGLLFVGGLINVMNLLDVPSYYQRMTIGGLLFTLVVAGGLLMRLRQR